MNRFFLTVSFLALTLILILSSPAVFPRIPNTVSAQTDSLQTGYADWAFTIVGAVSNPLNVSMSEFTAMPQTEVNATLECQIVICSGTWTGVQISYLLNQAGANPAAYLLEFHASDGYEVNLDVDTAVNLGVIIADEFDGQPIGPPMLVFGPGPEWIQRITEIDVMLPTPVTPTSATTTPAPSEVPPPSPTPQPTVTPTQTQPAAPSTTAQPTQNTTTNSITSSKTQPTASTQQSPINTQTASPQPSFSAQPQSQSQANPQDQTNPLPLLTPTTNGLGAQLTQPTVDRHSSSFNGSDLIIVATIAAAAIIGGVSIFRRRKKP